MAEDGQTSFLGGMRDNVEPDKLAPDEYFFGEGIELRSGIPETRRGSINLHPDIPSLLPAGDVLGAGIHRNNDAKQDTILFAKGEDIFRVTSDFEFIKFNIPDPQTAPEVRFVQALDRMYIFRGEGNSVWRWSGNLEDDIVEVPQPITGTLMPGSTRVTYAYNRFWITVGNDTLRISDVLSEAFDFNLNSFQVEQGEGGRLIKIQSFGSGNLIAFKDNGIAFLSGAASQVTALGLGLQFIDDEIGCISQDSVVNIGKDIFFLSQRGVYTVQQTSEQNAQLVDVPLSDPIRNIFETIEKQHIEKSIAVLFDNYYLLSVPVKGSQVNNAIIPFDLLLRKWVGIWTPTDFTNNRFISLGRERPKLISIGQDAEVIELLRGRHLDRDRGANTILTFRSPVNTRKPTIDMDSFLTSSGFNTKSTSMIYFRIRFTALPASRGMIMEFSKSGSARFVFIELIKASSDPLINDYVIRATAGQTGDIKWDIITNTTIEKDRWYTVLIDQDGVQPKIYLDGKDDTVISTFSLGGSPDNTYWIDTDSLARLRVGEPILFTGTLDSFEGHLSQIAFLDAAGWSAIIGNFPLNEGGNTSQITIGGYEVVAGQSVKSFTATFDENGTPTDHWRSLAATKEIISELQTKAYNFGGNDLNKRLNKGEISLTHMQPDITMDTFNSQPFDEEQINLPFTFSLTKYDVRGRADWVASNVNDDFETPFRQDYAPVDLPTSGINITPSGIFLDKRQSHTKFISSMAIDKWFRFKIRSVQGMMGIDAVSLTGDISGAERTKSFIGRGVT